MQIDFAAGARQLQLALTPPVELGDLWEVADGGNSPLQRLA
jgi:hypothetical protein